MDASKQRRHLHAGVCDKRRGQLGDGAGIDQRFVALIPARYASTRLPGKVLADLDGRPMIEHVYRRASLSPLVSETIVVTDDLRIATRVTGFGGKVRLSKAHETGTDRLAEIAATIDCDVVVNVQGDEPLVDPGAIAELVAPFLNDSGLQMTTLFRRIHDPAELTNPNVVKVVVDRGGYALYFSRAPIPHVRDPRGGWPPMYRHIGLYAYRRSALLVLASLEPTPLERAESLEQLRALEHRIRIHTVETRDDSIGVDTPEDLERARARLQAMRASEVA
jgi:3-deoxy-manno-octulosonate cytidylyltransferase (CMP-KDO synthetase)